MKSVLLTFLSMLYRFLELKPFLFFFLTGKGFCFPDYAIGFFFSHLLDWPSYLGFTSDRFYSSYSMISKMRSTSSLSVFC